MLHFSSSGQPPKHQRHEKLSRRRRIWRYTAQSALALGALLLATAGPVAAGGAGVTRRTYPVNWSTMPEATWSARFTLTWSDAHGGKRQLNKVHSVSCPSEHLCVAAAGTAILTTTHPATGPGAWHAIHVPGGPKTYGPTGIDSVSCPSPSLCLRIGRDVLAVRLGPPCLGPPCLGHWDPAAVEPARQYPLDTSGRRPLSVHVNHNRQSLDMREPVHARTRVAAQRERHMHQ